VLRDADETARNLAAGKAVSTEARARARDAFLDQLWRNSPGTQEAAQRGLLEIYEHSHNEQERSGLIGELVAAGNPAKELLEKIVKTEPSLAWLLPLLPLPLSEKLTRIAYFLASEAGEVPGESDPGSDSPTAPSSNFPRVVFDRPEESQHDKKPDRDDGGPKIGDGPPELERTLLNPDLDQPTRLDAAMRMGDASVPVLASLLTHPDEGEREFAMVAMSHLGKADATWRQVHTALQRFEMQTGHRRFAESILEGIEAARHPEAAETGARKRPKSAAGAPDGWLRRALRDCDAPSILQASAGREAFAITLAVKRYAELRKHEPGPPQNIDLGD
jgi:hypothetical protein